MQEQGAVLLSVWHQERKGKGEGFEGREPAKKYGFAYYRNCIIRVEYKGT